MPDNNEMTCRLLAASAVSYWIERAGGLIASPLYGSVGYVAAPTILEGGKDGIDAITVGSTTDGCGVDVNSIPIFSSSFTPFDSTVVVSI